MKLIPLSQADPNRLAALMDEEEQSWLRELDWDYGPVRRILKAFLKQRLLPGFVLEDPSHAAGYSYFVTSGHKGVVGALYASPPEAQSTSDIILSRAVESLKETRPVKRIEAQIIPLNDVDVTSEFTRHGFKAYLRHYMELDLASCAGPPPEYPGRIVPWHPNHLLPAATVAYKSYRGSIDALICQDYGSVPACESYLRSLVENPGCGIFLPGCSYVGLDGRGTPSGFILVSRISSRAAMIPQISIHPAYQGKGLGTALILTALKRLVETGYRNVRLTVSHDNDRACGWYLRLGFTVRRDFHACVWQRS